MRPIIGTSFEEHVWSGVWLRRFSPSAGWSSARQKPLAGGYRIDFAAWQGSYRAVGDAKDKAFVTYGDVDKLIEDAGVYKAQRLSMIVAGDTEFPNPVREYADDYGVEIVWTRWFG